MAEKPKTDLDLALTELSGAKSTILTLLDKCWELGGQYVGEKEFEGFSWVIDARQQVADINTLTSNLL